MESNRNILDTFCISFCKIVEKYTDYIIVSGFVAISTGRTRGTEDIDMILPKISKETFTKLHKELIKNNFVCVQSDDPEEIYNDYLIQKDSIRYTYNDKPLPEMEIKLVKDELDQEQILKKIKIKETNLDVWFSPIEANIAFKEEYLKSKKDLEDARHLRIIFKNNINENEITRIKQKIKKLRLN